MGPTLKNIPDESWEIVQKEKPKDMLHLLQFPYNGEPPRVSLLHEPEASLLKN
jgi:sulfite oxidase